MSDSELEPELRDMKLEGTMGDRAAEGAGATKVKVEDADSARQTPTPLAVPSRSLKSRSTSASPAVKPDAEAPSPGSAEEETLGGDITLKMEPGKVRAACANCT
jgi:histone-lysine N-methyltransferase SETD2